MILPLQRRVIMSDEIVFYYNPMSRARIVHWMLEEIGAPYRIEVVRLDRAEHKKPAFLAINPMGKLPALVHRGVAVTETAAILAYLADAFPKAALAPEPTAAARGAYYRWLFFGAGCVEPALMDRMMSRPAAEKPGAMGYGTYEDTVATLEKALTPGPYILGDRFSAADVYIASQIGFGMMVKALESRPAFGAYLARTSERPAYKRAVEQAEKIQSQLAA
jgi:glutathione S-transferase